MQEYFLENPNEFDNDWNDRRGTSSTGTNELLKVFFYDFSETRPRLPYPLYL